MGWGSEEVTKANEELANDDYDNNILSPVPPFTVECLRVELSKYAVGS